jgi:uncharacterized protein
MSTDQKSSFPSATVPADGAEFSPAPALGRWLATLAVAAVAWVATYAHLADFADAVVTVTGLQHGTRLADAIRFFAFDTPKVLLLLTLIVFVMGVIQSFFSPERTRALLAGRREGIGNVMAASLGIVTPFCSCSAVPMFMGFLMAGVPLGVTFSFLISAPMVNEIALGLLFAMFGWKVAALYLGVGLSVAMLAGWVIGRLDLQHWLEDWVQEMLQADGAAGPEVPDGMRWVERLATGWQHVRNIVGKVWPYIIAGIAVGAGIHGYVPADFMASIMGRDAPWWSVPAAVLIGVPMYSNAAGIIPVVEALLAKGAALGTVLAFMMSVIALSLPEFVILRKVLKVKLIAVFAAVVAAGILLVGYLFNAVL